MGVQYVYYPPTSYLLPSISHSPVHWADMTIVQYERLRVIYRQTDVGDIGPRLPDPAVGGSAAAGSLKATSSGKKEL